MPTKAEALLAEDRARRAQEAAAKAQHAPKAQKPGEPRKPGPGKRWPIKSIRETGRLARAGRSAGSIRAAAVYLAILVHLPKSGRTYVGTLVKLGAWLGLDRAKDGGSRTVSRALDDLVAVGLVSRKYTPQGERGRVTIELLDAPEKLASQDRLPAMDGPCPESPPAENAPAKNGPTDS